MTPPRRRWAPRRGRRPRRAKARRHARGCTRRWLAGRRGRTRSDRSRLGGPPCRAIGDVLLEPRDPVVRGGGLVGHAGLLHHPPRAHVLRVTDGNDPLEADRPKAVGETRDAGLGTVSGVPGGSPVVARDLNLPTSALDEHQTTIA